MTVLIPDHVDARHLDELRAVSPEIEISLLHIARHRPLWARSAGFAARRLLPFSLYRGIQRTVEQTAISLSVDGAPLEKPRPGIDALLATWAFDAEIARRVVAALPDLRWLHSSVSGVEHFDLRQLAERNILLTSARAIHARRIAEFVMALVYADAKNVLEHFENTRRRQGRFLRSVELRDLTVGIVGYGGIGQEIARLARVNGCRVIAYVRDAGRAARLDGVEVVTDLVAALGRSDVLAVALPLTPLTRHLISARELRSMRRTALLVNVGRAGTISEADLAAALKDGVIRRAFLDVVEDPMTGRSAGSPPRGHPLCRLGNVLFTGYSASESRHAGEELFADFLDNVKNRLQGKLPRGQINLSAGY